MFFGQFHYKQNTKKPKIDILCNIFALLHCYLLDVYVVLFVSEPSPVLTRVSAMVVTHATTPAVTPSGQGYQLVELGDTGDYTFCLYFIYKFV